MKSVLLLIFLVSIPFQSGFAQQSKVTASGEAREAFSRAIEYREQNRLMDAETELQKALELDPANADYRFELANLYALRFDISRGKTGKNADYTMLDRAASQLEQVVMMKPNYLAARYNLAVIYKRAGKYEKAREELKKVLQQDPKQVSAFMQIGAVYEEQGFYEEARSYYEKAKELDYGNPNIQSAIENLGEHRKDADERDRADMATRFRSQHEMMTHSMRTGVDQFSTMDRDGTASQDSRGIGQALPYLGSMLANQFTQGREEE